MIDRPLVRFTFQAICVGVCLGVLLFYVLVWVFDHPNILGSDFSAYLTGAIIVNNGDSSSLYNMDVQKAVQSRLI